MHLRHENQNQNRPTPPKTSPNQSELGPLPNQNRPATSDPIRAHHPLPRRLACPLPICVSPSEIRWGRNWYRGRHLGRLGAQTGNIRQGDASMTSTSEERPRRRRLVAAFVPLGLGLFFLVN